MDLPTSAINAVICRERDNPEVVLGFQKFRKRFFVDQLGWQLPVSNGCERDEFDIPEAVYCVLFDSSGVVGGWRAIPTNLPYLSSTLFSELAVTDGYPKRSDIWEISRFGQMQPRQAGQPSAGLVLYALMFQFAVTRGCPALVAVADLFHERLLRRVGIRTRRYGPPKVVGQAKNGQPLTAVAGEIPVSEQNEKMLNSLLALASDIEVFDETLVYGLDRISA